MATTPQSQAWSPLDGSRQQTSPYHEPNNLESPLDLTPRDAAARQGVLTSSIFPSLNSDNDSPEMESAEEMQRNDPLGTQIWKLYNKARTQLPNAERMENLTWRMMAMKMRGAAERERNKGYGCRNPEREGGPHPAPAPSVDAANSAPSVCRPAHGEPLKAAPMAAPPRPAMKKSAPSGIAQQLRRSVDQQAHAPPASDPNAMNIDDFIQPSSVGSPAGLAPSPSNDTPSVSATAPAIPIRKAANQHHHDHHDQDLALALAHASAPPVPPELHRGRENEFGYVQRRVRKTSIDERRVSFPLRPPWTMHLLLTLPTSLPSGAPRRLPWCRPSTAS